MSSYLRKIEIARKFVGEGAWRGFCLSLLVGVVFFISESLLAFAIPLFFINLDVVSPDNIPLFLQDLPRSLSLAVACVFLCVTLRSVGIMFGQYIADYVDCSFVASVRKRLVGIGIDRRSVVNSHTIFYFMNDVSLKAGTALQDISIGLALFVSVFILLTLSFFYAPGESAIALALLSFMVVPLRFFDKKIEHKGKMTGLHSKKLVQSLTEGFNTFFLFKLYGRLGEIVSSTENSIDEYARTHKSYALSNAIKANISLVVGSLVLCSTALFSYYYFGTNGAKLVAFFYLFIRIVQQCSNIVFNFSRGFFYLPQLKEMHEWIVRQENAILHTPEPSPLSEGEGKHFQSVLLREGIVIEGKGVSFCYPDSKILFENIDFNISRERPLVIKGRSGSGKSTLLMLLLGHLMPQKGRITVNGIDTLQVRNPLSDHIGYVGAESYIIQGSVRSNLLYGHQGGGLCDDSKLWEILRDVQLDQDIRQLDGQLEHELLELTQLSTGQKQRLAIARALLRKPKLLLLDEATANLDQVTEQNFINVLTPRMKEMTVVIISHKPSFDSIEGTVLNLGEG